jgi:hypothetical protein
VYNIGEIDPSLLILLFSFYCVTIICRYHADANLINFTSDKIILLINNIYISHQPTPSCLHFNLNFVLQLCRPVSSNIIANCQWEDEQIERSSCERTKVQVNLVQFSLNYFKAGNHENTFLMILK